MAYPYHTPSYHLWSIPNTYPPNPSFTSPTTPSFPSFPWELFTPCYTYVGSSSPSLYPNHGYSPHPPNPNPYSSYSSSHYSYYYNSYHQHLQPTNPSSTIGHKFQNHSSKKRYFEKHLQVSYPCFKRRFKKTFQKPIQSINPFSTSRKLLSRSSNPLSSSNFHCTRAFEDKELGDSRKERRWGENTAPKSFGETHRVTVDLGNRDANFDQQCESKWNTRWGHNEKDVGSDEGINSEINNQQEEDLPSKVSSTINSGFLSIGGLPLYAEDISEDEGEGHDVEPLSFKVRISYTLIETLIHTVAAVFLCGESKKISNIVISYASHHLFAKMHIPIYPKLERTASVSSMKKKVPRPPLKPTCYIKPEVELVPVADSPSSFSPSPYSIKHKCRGPRFLKMLSEASELSKQNNETIDDKSNNDFFPGDIAKRLNLISKVHGLEQTKCFFKDTPEAKIGQKVYAALLSCYSEHKSLEEAEDIMKKIKKLCLNHLTVCYNMIPPKPLTTRSKSPFTTVELPSPLLLSNSPPLESTFKVLHPPQAPPPKPPYFSFDYANCFMHPPPPTKLFDGYNGSATAIYSKEIGDGVFKQEAEKNDGLDECAPSVRYVVRRLIRGVSSSRECARQGFALGLTVLVGAIDKIKAESFLKLVVDLLEVTSSMKGHEAKDCFLGRLFAYGALARSRRIIQEWSLDKNTPYIKEFVGILISLATKKQNLQEPAVLITLYLVEKLPARALANHINEAPGLDKWFESAAEVGNPDALFLALKVRKKISIDNSIYGKLLPNPFSSSQLFSVDHLSLLSNYLKEATFCQPCVHSIWVVLVNTLILNIAPQLEDAASASNSLKKHKKSRKSCSYDEEIAKNLKSFWKIIIEESLLFSSHDRKRLAFNVMLLLLQNMSAFLVIIVLSNKVVQGLMDILPTNNTWLYKVGKQFLKQLSYWVGDNDVKRVAVIVAIMKHINGKFDSITRTKHVKNLMSHFKTEPGCMFFVQSMMNLFVDEDNATEKPSNQSQTTDENSEIGSIKNKHSPSTYCILSCSRDLFKSPTFMTEP